MEIIGSIYSYQHDLKRIMDRISHCDNEYIRVKIQRKLDKLKEMIDDNSEVIELLSKYLPNQCGTYIVYCTDNSYIDMIDSWFRSINKRVLIDTSINCDSQFSNCINVHILNDLIDVDNCDGIIFIETNNKNYMKKLLMANIKNLREDIPVLYFVDSIKSLDEMCFQFKNEAKHLSNIKEVLTLSDDISWYDYYDLAYDYYSKNHNLNMDLNYKIFGLKLGWWIGRQKYLLNRGKTKSLSDDKIVLLSNIGITCGDYNEWIYNYELAKDYYESHGHLSIPKNFKVNDICLGHWLAIQRKRYNNQFLQEEKDKNLMPLTTEQIRLLDLIGMVWNIKKFTWYDYYELAKKYYEEHGDLLIPRNYRVDNINLGNWIRTQRRAYRDRSIPFEQRVSGLKMLSDEKISLLEKIGMVWVVNNLTWFDYYELAKNFYNKNGHLFISNTYEVNGIKLGKWISRQRAAYFGEYSLTPLTQQQISMLCDIGMVFEHVNERMWFYHYNIAKEFFLKNGHLLVSSRYEINGFKLGNWINCQRAAYKNRILPDNQKNGSMKALSDIQVSLLNEIHMVWSVDKALSYYKKIDLLKLEKMFYEYLSIYEQTHDNTFVSYDNIKDINMEFSNYLDKAYSRKK